MKHPMQPRYYQREAFQAALDALRAGHNPVVQMATGTGKSLTISLIAEHCRRNGGQVWVLTHAQVLVEQNAANYRKYSGLEPAVVCSGLNRRDTWGGVTYGTIQTVAGAVEVLKEPSLIIIDEAHRVPHKTGDQGQYERLFQRYPMARRVAMSATPWRTDDGLIYGADPEQFWFDVLAYTYTVPQGVADGFLCPLVGVETEVQLKLPEPPSSGDYVPSQIGDLQDTAWLAAVAESLSELTLNRHHVAVYTPSIPAAMRAVVQITRATGQKCELLHSKLAVADRREVMSRFTSGESKFLVSVDMITTGFDFPALDCIVVLRPTTSSNLWVQIQGRGTRLHPSKKNCLLLDYVGNLQRLGGVDVLDTYVKQRNPHEPIAAEPAARKPAARRTLPGVSTLAPLDPMTGEQARDGAELTVQVHAVGGVAIPTRRDPTRPALMVNYTCSTAEGARVQATLFLNTERPTPTTTEFFAVRRLAVGLPAPARQLTWMLRKAPVPDYVVVRKTGRYWNVVREVFQPPTQGTLL